MARAKVKARSVGGSIVVTIPKYAVDHLRLVAGEDLDLETPDSHTVVLKKKETEEDEETRLLRLVEIIRDLQDDVDFHRGLLRSDAARERAKYGRSKETIRSLLRKMKREIARTKRDLFEPLGLLSEWERPSMEEEA